jgi:6,7-dimethyl-8-ribityllumazine synthase
MTIRTQEGSLRTDGRRFAIIASRFNNLIVERLIDGAVQALHLAGASDRDIEIFRCPGALEIPGLARRVAANGRFQGLVCLGAVIRGATAHFDIVVEQSARGMAALGAEGQVAIGMGVLACHSLEQALERAGDQSDNRGADAARVAVEMAHLYAALSDGTALKGSAA